MFERLMRRAVRVAEARARERARRLAERLETELPGGVSAEIVEEGVRLSGRDIARRFAIEPRLRWLARELIE